MSKPLGYVDVSRGLIAEWMQMPQQMEIYGVELVANGVRFWVSHPNITEAGQELNPTLAHIEADWGLT